MNEFSGLSLKSRKIIGFLSKEDNILSKNCSDSASLPLFPQVVYISDDESSEDEDEEDEEVDNEREESQMGISDQDKSDHWALIHTGHPLDTGDDNERRQRNGNNYYNENYNYCTQEDNWSNIRRKGSTSVAVGCRKSDDEDEDDVSDENDNGNNGVQVVDERRNRKTFDNNKLETGWTQVIEGNNQNPIIKVDLSTILPPIVGTLETIVEEDESDEEEEEEQKWLNIPKMSLSNEVIHTVGTWMVERSLDHRSSYQLSEYHSQSEEEILSPSEDPEPGESSQQHQQQQQQQLEHHHHHHHHHIHLEQHPPLQQQQQPHQQLHQTSVKTVVDSGDLEPPIVDFGPMLDQESDIITPPSEMQVATSPDSFDSELLATTEIRKPHFKSKAPKNIWSPGSTTTTSSCESTARLPATTASATQTTPTRTEVKSSTLPHGFRPVTFNPLELDASTPINITTSSDNNPPDNCLLSPSTISEASTATDVPPLPPMSRLQQVPSPPPTPIQKYWTLPRHLSKEDPHHHQHHSHHSGSRENGIVGEVVSDRPPPPDARFLYETPSAKYFSLPTTVAEKSSRVIPAPRKFDGIGPVNESGVPVALRTGVKEEFREDWYKTMFKRLHKFEKPRTDLDEPIRVKLKSGKPDYPRFASDFLDNNEGSSRMVPRNIADYEPGHSSISLREKQMADDKEPELSAHQKPPRSAGVPYHKNCVFNALTSNNGYESDSSYIIKKKEPRKAPTPASRSTYCAVQRGDIDIPFSGLQKPAPQPRSHKVVWPPANWIEEPENGRQDSKRGDDNGNEDENRMELPKSTPPTPPPPPLSPLPPSVPPLRPPSPYSGISEKAIDEWERQMNSDLNEIYEAIEKKGQEVEDLKRGCGLENGSLDSMDPDRFLSCQRDAQKKRMKRSQEKDKEAEKDEQERGFAGRREGKDAEENQDENEENGSMIVVNVEHFGKDAQNKQDRNNNTIDKSVLDTLIQQMEDEAQFGLEQDQDSRHKFDEDQVNIHYKTPIQHLVKDDILNEEELIKHQRDQMRRYYEGEYQNQKRSMKDSESNAQRRHHFTPKQEHIVHLDRYQRAYVDKDSSQLYHNSLARVVYDFNAKSGREISAKKGDIVIVQRQIDPNWVEVEDSQSGLKGLVPKNYLDFEKSGSAKAKYDFEAKTPVEIPLQKSETVKLLRKVDDNWYEGINSRGDIGIFPCSYVETIKSPLSLQLNNNSYLSMPSSSFHRPSSPQKIYSRSLSPTLPPTSPTRHLNGSAYGQDLYKGPGGSRKQQKLYRVIYPYKPQQIDELELLAGDILTVTMHCDDGWFVGHSTLTGQYGTFPGNYVEPLM